MKKEIKTLKANAINEANAYLLINKEDKTAILIDGAYSSSLILKNLDENAIILTDIFVTHFHHDHTVGLYIIALKTGATVHIHELDYEFLFNENINDTQNGQIVDFANEAIVFSLFNNSYKTNINGFAINVLHKGGHTKETTFMILIRNIYLLVIHCL